MSDSMQEQLEEIFDNEEVKPTSPRSALAILWMDTAYRLSNLLLGQANRARAAEKKPPLVPGMTDLHNSMQYIGSFDSYFAQAADNEDGTPDWSNVDRNKTGLRSITYSMYDEITRKLVEHAQELKGVNLAVTATGVIKERKDGTLYIPDETGPDMSEFAQPVASKVAFYGFKLISMLRSNGGSKHFSPKSQSSISDILDLREIEINDLEDVRDDPVDIDHLEMSWDITQTEMLKPSNVYTLSGVDLQQAENVKAAFDAWMSVYENIHDNNDKLTEEIDYQVEQAKAWVEQQRKQSDSPVKGVEKTQG